MTTWTNDSKTGVSEVGQGLDVDASSNALLYDATNKLLVSNSFTLSGESTWTGDSKS